MTVQRRTADCIHGYASVEEAEVHCDQGYLIGIGQCPNGCGAMPVNDGGQSCVHCNFSTNSKRSSAPRSLAQRIAPGEWHIEEGPLSKGKEFVISVKSEDCPFPKDVAIIGLGFDEPFEAQQHTHAELFMEALKTAKATGLSPSELHRLVVLMARYVGFFTPGAGGENMRVLFDLIVRRAAEKRSAEFPG